MISFLKLIRYKNLLMVLLTMVLTKYALIDSFVEKSYLSDYQFSIFIISILFITAGGYIINDIVDIEADKINKPNKVFIDKTFTKKSAKKGYLFLTFCGIISGCSLSFIVNKPIYSLIYFLTVIGLYLYSSYFKKTSLIGNLIVSTFIGLSIITLFIFELINFTKGFETLVLSFYIGTYVIFSFLTTLIREIIKDIEDINGDLKINAKTLPIVFGRKRANRVAFSISIILMILFIFISKSFLIEFPLFFSYSIVFVLLPLLFFMYKLWNAESKKEYSKLSQLMKMIMFFGILSMLFFKFI